MVHSSWPRLAVVVGVVVAVVVAVVYEQSSKVPLANAASAPFNASSMAWVQVTNPSITADRSVGLFGVAPNVNRDTMSVSPRTASASDASCVFTRSMEWPLYVWQTSTPPLNSCAFVNPANDMPALKCSSAPDGRVLHSHSSLFILVA